MIPYRRTDISRFGCRMEPDHDHPNLLKKAMNVLTRESSALREPTRVDPASAAPGGWRRD
jgi:hypothetical protein